LRELHGGSPEIVIAGNITGETSGNMEFQGTGQRGAIGAGGAFVVRVPATATVNPPEWGNVAFPFLGSSPGQNQNYIVTTITVGGIPIFDLLAGNIPTPSPSPSPTPTPTPTPTPSPTPEPSPTPPPTPSPTPTPEVSPTPEPIPTPGIDPTPTPEPIPTPGVDPTPVPTPTPEVSPTPEPIPTPGVDPTPTPEPIPTPGVSPTPEPTPTQGASPTPEPTPTQGADLTPTPPPSDAPYVFINHLYAGGSGNNNPVSHSFIELYNPTDTAIELDGYSLQVSNAASQEEQADWNVIPLNGYIQPDSSFLVVSTRGVSTLAGYRVISKWDLETDFEFSHQVFSAALVRDTERLPLSLDNEGDRIIDLVVAINNNIEPLFASPTFISNFNDVEPLFENPTRISNLQGVMRNNFQNTKNNSADFITIFYAELSGPEWRQIRPRFSGDGARGDEVICTHCVVSDCIPGDINGDGRITSLDATTLARYIVNPDGVDICAHSAYFFGVENIGVAHVTLVARWLVGHNVEPFQREL
jgi:hypothetical protein